MSSDQSSEGAKIKITRAQGKTARFLQESLTKVMALGGYLTHEAFMDIVPPQVIASSLTDTPDLQARMLQEVANIPHEIGRELSATNATEIMEHALKKIPSTVHVIPETLKPSEWAACLSSILVWKLISFGDWHLKAIPSSNPESEKAIKALLGILKLIDELELVTPSEKLQQIGIDALIEALPVPHKNSALRLAITYGEEGRPYTAEMLFSFLPPDELLQHVRSAVLWDRIVLFVANRLELIPDGEKATEAKHAPEQSPERVPDEMRPDPAGQESGTSAEASSHAEASRKEATTAGAADDGVLEDVKDEEPVSDSQLHEPPVAPEQQNLMKDIFDTSGAPSVTEPEQAIEPERTDEKPVTEVTEDDVTINVE